MGQYNPTAARAHVKATGNRIDEVDIGLNYYKAFRNHAQAVGTTYICLREIVVHELGHMAGLEDVYFDPDPNAPADRKCHDYEHYTMNGDYVAGDHFRESLRCEDKYALDQKYQ